MIERLREEVIFDPKHLREYIAVREERLDDGRIGGVLIASGTEAEEVHVALKLDQQNHEKAIYHFYRPTTEPNNRVGWAIGERK